MPDQIEIQPTPPLDATIRPPGSKSITNRALVCSSLADGKSTLSGALDSEDTRVMIEGLRKLGLSIDVDVDGRTVTVEGCGGHIPMSQADLFVANSGTTIRFLTSLLALGHGTYRLDGNERMRERPIGDLLSGLAQLGADVTSEQKNGCPPVIVKAAGLRGGRAVVGGEISSQFLSGLLMAAPYAERKVNLTLAGQLVSKPYVKMTLGVMSAFGVQVQVHDTDHFEIDAPSCYTAQNYLVEPDASAASYFWGAAAIAGGTVTVEGLDRRALQGDVAFCDYLHQMGCDVQDSKGSIAVTGGALRGIDVDMNAISDTVQTLAAVALFAAGPTTITGVAHIRHKETDRIRDLACELRKLGASVDELPDGLRITPIELHGAEIETYDDHRMAMSLSLVGLRVPGIVIKDPDCTQKTYPSFFQDLRSLATST